MTQKSSTDRLGRTVEVGMMVRVLQLHPSIQNGLGSGELERVKTMVGDVLRVADIDEYGGVWVEKWWDDGLHHHVSHSLALRPDEIELA